MDKEELAEAILLQDDIKHTLWQKLFSHDIRSREREYTKTSRGQIYYHATIKVETCYTCEVKRYYIVDHYGAKKLDSGWLSPLIAEAWLDDNEYETW